MRRTALLAAVAMSLAACGTGLNAGNVDGAWELVSGTHEGSAIPILRSHPITLNLDGDSIGGTAACNSYGGTYQIGVAGAFSIGDGLAITEAACMPPEVMEAERVFMNALAAANRINRSGDTVTLTGPATDLTFKLLPPVPVADLVGTVWVLDGLINRDAVTSIRGNRATLVLNTDGSFTGGTGCRTISGIYVVSGAEVEFTSFGAGGECSTELQDQDSRVISALEGGFRVEIEGERMTTWTSGDEGLIYKAES